MKHKEKTKSTRGRPSRRPEIIAGPMERRRRPAYGPPPRPPLGPSVVSLDAFAPDVS